jgi:hypothetical protein
MYFILKKSQKGSNLIPKVKFFLNLCRREVYRAKSEKNQTYYGPVLRKPSILYGSLLLTYRNEKKNSIQTTHGISFKNSRFSLISILMKFLSHSGF